MGMVQIEAIYEGGLRTRATHGPSGTTLITDAPVDNQGKGESFSPTDLVATATVSCMLTIMGIVAERHGWPLVGARASVNKRMALEPTRKIGALEVVVSVPGDWTEAQRSALEKAALGCPVHATLHGNVELPVRFDWGV
jgi:putative redox protein